jgi:hypothetical protein
VEHGVVLSGAGGVALPALARQRRAHHFPGLAYPADHPQQVGQRSPLSIFGLGTKQTAGYFIARAHYSRAIGQHQAGVYEVEQSLDGPVNIRGRSRTAPGRVGAWRLPTGS